MKKPMRWMWEYEVVTQDEKGKPVKSTAFSNDPVENGKKIKVAYFKPKESR